MSDTLENLQRRKGSATELSSVVRTMKAMAASNIGQYEMAVKSLQDYYRTVSLGICACLPLPEVNRAEIVKKIKNNETNTIAIVFGSDQGMAGRFNDTLAAYVHQALKEDMRGIKEVWAIGERMVSELSNTGFTAGKNFTVPNSVNGITPLVNGILIEIEQCREKKQMEGLYIFHNAPYEGGGYHPIGQQLLPLDNKWKQELSLTAWPTKNPPEVIGGSESIFPSLIKEYLFVLLYKACAESLCSENASRLEAMRRAEKNIDETLDDLNQRYNRLRQSTIDEELFDVVSGFEALKREPLK